MDWERRALDLLQRLVQDAVPQAGPGAADRDMHLEPLTAVCAEAETLLHEARGLPGDGPWWFYVHRGDMGDTLDVT